MAVEAVPLEVLNVGISGEDFSKNLVLDLVGVCGDILDVVQLFLVVLSHAETIGCLRHGDGRGGFNIYEREGIEECVCVYGVGREGGLYRGREGERGREMAPQCSV